MSRPQTYRNVEIPDTFADWSIDARVNYLCNAMDREQIAATVREMHGLEPENKTHFGKDELAEMVANEYNTND